MMRIGIQTWGSEGDVRPFLALGGGLARAGHEVTLVITDLDARSYEAYAEKLGVTIRMVARPTPKDLDRLDEVGERLLQVSPFEQGKLITREIFMPVVPALFDAARELCAHSDLVVGHFFHYPLRTAAELAGVPEVSVTLSGDVLPSAAYPPTGLPSLGAAANRALWWVAGRAIDSAFLPPVNALRRSVSLPLLDSMRQAWHSSLLDLVAVSPTLTPPQSDWPRAHAVPGFFALPADGEPDAVSPEIERFLAAGAPPVYFGFGSLAPKGSATRAALLALFEEAIERSGCRAIIQGLGSDAVGSERILHVARSAHARVFPRCAAVVHHGGAGTTQSAVRAGVPSVIVPHVSDQFAWAAVLQRAGTAPSPLPRRKLSAERLASRIRQAIAPAMQTRARDLARALEHEDGVGTAVRMIERAAAAPLIRI